jgi:hypothetical protein
VRPLQRQEKRSRGGICSGQPEHQQQRANDSAGSNRRCKPGHIVSLERHLRRSRHAKNPRPHATQHPYANASPAIEEPRQDGGVNCAEQNLCSGSREAEQCCRGKGV